MKTEYVVNKGRGDSWIEVYRSDDKQDAINVWLERTGAREEECDAYSETLTTRIMIWYNLDAPTDWVEYAEEQVSDSGEIIHTDSRAQA